MENNSTTYHIPVMLHECLEGLSIHPDGVYVDVTFGGGGHSRAIFEKLSPNGKLIVFDQDVDAQANLWEAPNFFFIPANFSFLTNHLRALGIKQVDGILAQQIARLQARSGTAIVMDSATGEIFAMSTLRLNEDGTYSADSGSYESEGA